MQLAAHPPLTSSQRTLQAARAALDRNNLDEAEVHLRQAAQQQPNNPGVHAALARLLLRQSDLPGHDQAIARAIALAPNDAGYRIRAALACPPMMGSRLEIERHRARVIARLDALLAEPGRWRLSDPMLAVPTLTYYFVYHGLDDRSINRRVCALMRQVAPILNVEAPHLQKPRPDGPVRLGIFSTHLRDHTIGCLFAELIKRLDRRMFRTVMIFSEPDIDPFALKLAESAADEVVLVPRELPRAQQQIAQARLDVLWYPDIGMDSFTTYLAYARLARAQVTTWGHPNATGIDTMDAFLSLDALEPEARPPYSETIICQQAPNVYYVPQRVTLPQPRAALGLPVRGHLYGCPQTTFKFHPDFNRVLCQILDRDPRAILVLHQGRIPAWQRILTQRLEAIRPGSHRRIHWMAGMPREQYIETLAAFDVMLDPFPFGGGNTTLEAFGAGTPVVTCPPKLARGRLAYAFYRQMGWTALVAGDADAYVRLAVDIATDPSLRAQMSTQLRARSDAELFENDEGVRQFEAALLAALKMKLNASSAGSPAR